MPDKDLLLISMPKSGSHMMALALGLLPYAQAALVDATGNTDEIAELFRDAPSYAWMHLPYLPEISDHVFGLYKNIVFLRRHPLDALVSMAHFIEGVPGTYFDIDGKIHKLPVLDRIEYYLANYESVFAIFNGWLNANCYHVKYEDIITKRAETMVDLKRHLGRGCADGMYERSTLRAKGTYRTGRTNNYQAEFARRPSLWAFAVKIGSHIRELGYELDNA